VNMSEKVDVICKFLFNAEATKYVIVTKEICW